MNKGIIFNIQRFSIHDGPGIRTTVFFKGCPLNCRWCANPESKSSSRQLLYNRKLCVECGTCIKKCPQKALSLGSTGVVRNQDACRKCLACASVCPTHALTVEGETYDIDTLMAEISKDKDFYIKSGGGVTLSGGEPLLQKDFAVEFINALREEKYNVGIETSGYAEPDDFREVVDKLDFLYIDFKHPDPSEHRKMTDVSNEKILNNIKYAAASGMDMAVRIPVIPHFNDSREVVQKYCDILSPLHIPQVHLLPFHQMGKAKWEALGIPYLYKDEPSLHNEDMEPLAEIFRKNGFCVQIGG